jgi:hypothetical protein
MGAAGGCDGWISMATGPAPCETITSCGARGNLLDSPPSCANCDVSSDTSDRTEDRVFGSPLPIDFPVAPAPAKYAILVQPYHNAAMIEGIARQP